MLLTLLFLTSSITLIMLIWLNSDALTNWGSLFGLSKLLKIEEFHKQRLDMIIRGMSMNLTYPNFLKEKYNYNFITQMLSCPLCLSVWLSSISCVITSVLFFNFLILLLIPPVTILSLLTYGVVTRLMKFSV
jgi:hypothetical protein